MFDAAFDAQVRTIAFNWLQSQVAKHGNVLPRAILADGFTFNDIRVPLISPQAIFKPRVLQEVPLSITTAPEGPYDDAFSSDGLLRYRYRGTDPEHPDNRGLRLAMIRRLPLVYFHGHVPGRYDAVWPVYIVGDHPESLTFSVAVEEVAGLRDQLSGREWEVRDSKDQPELTRGYATAKVRVRLHQDAFRERVLAA